MNVGLQLEITNIACLAITTTEVTATQQTRCIKLQLSSLGRKNLSFLRQVLHQGQCKIIVGRDLQMVSYRIRVLRTLLTAVASTSASQYALSLPYDPAATSSSYSQSIRTTPVRERATSNGYRDTLSNSKSSRLSGIPPAPGPPPPGPPRK